MGTTTEVSGVIKAANERGVRLDGEEEWRNWSRWAKAKVDLAAGQRVVLDIDASGFIRSAMVDDAPSSPSSPAASTPAASPGAAPAATTASREAVVTRLAVLNTATALLGAGAGVSVNYASVMRVAKVLEQFALTGEIADEFRERITPEQSHEIYRLAVDQMGLKAEYVKSLIQQRYMVERREEMSAQEAADFIKYLRAEHQKAGR